MTRNQKRTSSSSNSPSRKKTKPILHSHSPKAIAKAKEVAEAAALLRKQGQAQKRAIRRRLATNVPGAVEKFIKSKADKIARDLEISLLPSEKLKHDAREADRLAQQRVCKAVVRARSATRKRNLAKVVEKTGLAKDQCEALASKALSNLRDPEIGFFVVSGLVETTKEMKENPVATVHPSMKKKCAKSATYFKPIFNDKATENPQFTLGRYVAERMKRKKLRKIASTDPLDCFIGLLSLTPSNAWTALMSDKGSFCQRAHTDYDGDPPVPWKKRYENHKSESGPVSVVVCIQEGALLHFYGTDEALGPNGRPIHPTSRPSVDIHLKLNQAIIFRHDLWHGGAKYDLQHFRLFRYYKAVNPGIDLYLATGKDGVTYHCWCKCKKGDACTCPARTVSARRVEYVPEMLGVQVWSVRTTSA